MPTFGDFETVGDAVALSDERGHISTIWQARKAGGAESRLYAIKCYTPRRRKPSAGLSEEVLDRDRGLEFLEGIKQLKKAGAEGAATLAPVHAFGLAPEAAWYVTDFYPRGSLKAWITRRGDVDSGALRQVVHEVVAACLALKQSRGYSHGNLKPSNIFLVGKPQPLRKTPLHLADPYPASAMQLAGLEAEDLRTVGSLLTQTMEAQDLRTIGELILQLVEGRLFRSEYDYNYPVPRSPAWDRLGKKGERWRELCNRLLDPQLSLEKFSLAQLENETRLSVAARHLPLIATVLCVLIVSGIGAELGRHWVLSARKAKYERLMAEARRELNAANFQQAAEDATRALDIRPGDLPGKELLAEIQSRKQKLEARQAAESTRKYQTAILAARQALAAGKLEEASLQLDLALASKPGDEEANRLLREIQQQKDLARQTAESARQYKEAISRARQALTAGDFDQASRQVNLALEAQPGDPAANQLLAAIETRKSERKQAEQSQKTYQTAIASAKAAMTATNLDVATEQVNLALKTKPGDAAANALLKQILALKGAQEHAASVNREYQAALAASKEALNITNLEQAAASIDRALKLKPGDPAAIELSTRLQKLTAQRQQALESARNYQQAFAEARKSLAGGKFDEARRQATLALAAKPGDPAANRLLGEIKTRIEEQQRTGQLAEQYRKAISAARQALAVTNVEEATRQANIASSAKPGDPAVKNLLSQIRELRRAQEHATELEQQYTSAMAAARSAFTMTNLNEAKKKLELALGSKPGDSEANKLLETVKAAIKSESDRLYKKAFAAASTALKAAKLDEAAHQAKIALNIRRMDKPALNLLSRIDQMRRDRIPKLPGTSIQWVWINGIGPKQRGAYVAKTELSTADYRKLGGAPAVSQFGEEFPANVTYQEAIGLCEKLNQQHQQHGRFMLPTRDDFVILTGIKPGLFANGYSLTPGLEKYIRASGAATRIGLQTQNEMNQIKLRPVTDGVANRLGLVNVIGNAWEWCQDNVKGGWSYYSTGYGASSRSLFGGGVPNEPTTLRLIFVPGP